uniref:B1177_F1_32 n=1 Tax=Mycobacterium leprae TaxID=1769 RepID=Q49652_MYCLR|nr:B1177_F1_32 [Mycobacterium leprae]
MLLAVVAACVTCGIIYELAQPTLPTSLNGSGIVATSLIVASYIAVLGAEALAVKLLLTHMRLSHSSRSMRCRTSSTACLQRRSSVYGRG